ncbi:unnamed protein product [Hermetia illucens]|uniref:BHLH domain-containing protein n=1 Tax=Hermetia illucens TaxID=343691 RepID=A0A7R8UXM1_HERIL|nr:uncharacterized protein LOC119655000 [Hermetia illucens]CAD7089002.1 unnamed protein product [Hermetia illucens]
MSTIKKAKSKKPSEKNKAWEKDRRDRLNRTFEDLAKLLPQYDPTVTWSKNEIIQKSIAYIKELHEKHEKMLETHDPKALSDYKELLDTLRFFKSRNSQLADLLTKAKISIPPAKFPKLLTENNLLPDNPSSEFRLRPVGRPKKYSNLVVCNGNCNKAQSQENKENGNVNEAKKEDGDQKQPGPVEVDVSVTKSNETALNVSTTTAATAAVTKTTNAVISMGVLLPLIPCQPTSQASQTLQPPVIASQPLQSTLPVNMVQKVVVPPKCNISAIQNLPRLNCLPQKLAKDKDGKVKILPYPVLKVHVPRTDNKVPIPALKREKVPVKKKFRRRRKMVAPESTGKGRKRKLSKSVDCSRGERNAKVPKTEEKGESGTKEKTVEIPQANAENNDQKRIEQNQETITKTEEQVSMPENDLPEEYFTALQIPDANSNSTSVSPTAAFLLSFPVVNASGGGKTVGAAEEGAEDNQHEKGDNHHLSEGLENLNNFFSTKEYFKYCGQGTSGPDKIEDEKESSGESASKTVGTGNCATSGEAIVSSNEAKMLTESKVVNKPAIPTWPSQSCGVIASSGGSSVIATSSYPALISAPSKAQALLPSVQSFSSSNSTLTQGPELPVAIAHSMPSTTVGLEISGRSGSYINSSPFVGNITSSKAAAHPSNFSVSSIFTSSTSTIVTTKELCSQVPGTKDAIRSEPGKSIQPVSLNTPLTYSTSSSQPKTVPSSIVTTILPNYGTRLPSATNKLTLFPEIAISGQRPTKINTLPNPIPAALPQPTNFPTLFSSYPTIGKGSSSYATEIRPSGVVADGSTAYRAGIIVSSSTKILDSFSFISTTRNPAPTSTKPHDPLRAAEPNLSHFRPSGPSSVQCSAADSFVAKPNSKICTTTITTSLAQTTSFSVTSAAASTISGSAVQATKLSYPTTVGGVPSSAHFSKTTTTAMSLSKSIDPISTFVSVNSFTQPSLNIDNTFKPIFTNTSLTEVKTSVAEPNSATSVSKVNSLFNLDSIVTGNASSKYPASYTSTTSYYYPPMVPPISAAFTFSLTSTTSSSSTTTAISSQHQTYFPLTNVNQNAQWLPSSTMPEYCPPFTFSLTSCTTTYTTSTDTVNSCSYYKSTPSNNSFIKSSSDASPFNKGAYPYPEVTLPSVTYSSSSLTNNPPSRQSKHLNTLPEVIPSSTLNSATNFTFSLAKPKVSTTTVSSDLMKPLPSCNVTESKYQSYYNTYSYSNFSDTYSKEATSFTFALTKPSQSASLCSGSMDSRIPQRFTGSFSIDATLGTSTTYSPQNEQKTHTIPQQNIQTTAQNPDFRQTSSNMNKSNHFHHSQDATKNPPNYYGSNQEKQTKTSQKSHVNWMTSGQHSELANCNQQAPSYYPSYVAPSVDFNNKGNCFVPGNPEDNLPPWSPSKILDTSHLFPSIPAQQTYYNELNPLAAPNNESKPYPAPQKSYPKPIEGNLKSTKPCNKPSNQSQTSFFSVSQLVDQNAPKTCDTFGKKSTSNKMKDCLKAQNSSNSTLNSSQNVYHNQKPSTLNNYSAEALISKKEKHRSHPLPHSVHHLHNNDYYPSQNDSLNPYMSQESDNFNYNTNYFYNYMPANQNYMQDVDYLPSYSGDTQLGRTSTSFNRKPLPSGNSYRTTDKKDQSNVAPLPNLMPYDSAHNAPSMPHPLPTVDTFDPIHYGNNIQHSWGGAKTTGASYPNAQVVAPFGDEANLSGCNQVGTGSSGNNLTNFNLSTICPEISGKVGHNNW